MTWRDYLTRAELAALERAERNRERVREACNALKARLKNRAEARVRAEKARKAREHDDA